MQISCSWVFRCHISKKALQGGPKDSGVLLFGSSLRDDSQLEYSGFPSEMLLALALPSLGVFLWFPFVFLLSTPDVIDLVGQKRSQAINPSYPKQAVLLCDLY